MSSYRDYLDSAGRSVDDARRSSLPRGAAAFQGERAGLVTRMVAAVIDVLIVIGIVLLIALATWILSFIFTPLTSGFISEGNRRIPPVVVLVVIGYVITQIYFTVSWASSGRTVGNLIMGVRVVDYRGNRLAWWVAFLRAAFVIALPVGLFWVLVSGANRSVQDVVLRTSVIYDWVVGTPTLAAVIGRNREARRSS